MSSNSQPESDTTKSNSDAAVDAVAQPTDALDQRDFNAVDYLNGLFPTPESLAQLDDSITRMDVLIHRLDDEIVKAVRDQALNMDRGRKELLKAKESVDQLSAKIVAIRDKADASEQKVTEICKHIRSLDYAKRNLTVALKTLKQLQMFARCVERLNTNLNSKRYADAAEDFRAVAVLSKEFEAHSSVKQISQLNQCVRVSKQNAETVIYESFRPANDSKLPPVAFTSSLCEMVDALGDESREKFITWFCGARLEKYNAHFSDYSDDSSLDKLEKRFDWFKSNLESLMKSYRGVFPDAWCMPMRYAEEFCSTTRIALFKLLDPSVQSDLNVTSVVMALRATLDFERELMDKYEPDDPDMDEDEEDEEEDGSESEDEVYDKTTGRMVRQDKKSKNKKVKLAPPPKKFKGAISGVFKQQLERLYVPQEDKNIGDMLTRAIKDEKWTVDDNSPNKVFGSCTDLIYYMKTTMTRCVELSTGTPLLELHKIIRSYIRRYCEILKQRFPPGNKTPLTEEDVRLVCLIVNTSDFCRSRAEQFQRSFRKCYDGNPDAITFDPEISFIKKSVINAGVKLLSTLLMRQCESAFNEMARTNWSSIKEDNESPFVSTIQEAIRDNVPIIYKWLTSSMPSTNNTKFFELFCDLFVTSFSTTHLETLYRCKKFSTLGVNVLFINFKIFKDMLLSLPALGPTGMQATDDASIASVMTQQVTTVGALSAGMTTAAATAAAQRRAQKAAERWKSFVNNSMRKSEILIRTSMLTPEQIVKNYFDIILGTDRKGKESIGTVEDFKHVLELQDLSKAEKQRILEQFMAEFNNLSDGSGASLPPVAKSPSPSLTPSTSPGPTPISVSSVTSTVTAASQKFISKFTTSFH